MLDSSHRTFFSATLLVWLACPNSAWAAEPRHARFEATQPHMGTSFTIIVYAANKGDAEKGFAAAFARIKVLDDCLSDFKPESELSLLSAASPTKTPVRLSDDLFRVLAEAEKFSLASDGAFDVTVGPLTKLWRRARRQKQLPPPEMLHEALAAVGYKHLRLDAKSRTAELLRPKMRLDLGGIGQGFAADEAFAELRKLGLTRALINASGDILAGESPPGEAGWKVGIAPLKPDDPPSRFVTLKNRAVSTSGDAFQFVEIDGRRYSHIVDPRTGLGLSARTSVTIVAPDCTTADALATAVCVLGPEKGMKLIERTESVAGLFVYVDVGETTTKESEKWEKDKVAE